MNPQSCMLDLTAACSLVLDKYPVSSQACQISAFVPPDANRHRKDHYFAVTHHLIPTGAPRDWEADILHTHCARDGEGPPRAERADGL